MLFLRGIKLRITVCGSRFGAERPLFSAFGAKNLAMEKKCLYDKKRTIRID
jgi:hypothetical protein